MPANASADQLQVSVQTPAPEQGVPVTLLFSGTASAIDSYGDGPYLYAVVRPSGGIGCQPSFGSDQAAAGGASYDIFGSYTEVSPGSVSQQATYNPPNVNGYLVCAWLEDVSGDGSNYPATSSEVSAATSVTFSTRGPQVGQLSVNVAGHPQPGIAYRIDYTTQTDQQLTLYSVVKLAGGLPCASSYELEQQQNQSENDVFGDYTSVFGGPTTSTATDTEQDAGSHLICSWIEGPNSGEVDAALTTPIYVGTPPGPPPPPPVQLTSATELSAFLRWITSRYPGAHGNWVCPTAQISGDEGICLAEIKAGNRFHWMQASAKVQGRHVVLQHEYDTSWVRRWTRFGRRRIAGFNTPGTASVNSPAFDWAWLAAGAYYSWQHHRGSFSLIDYDGNSSGFANLFRFHCHQQRRRLITCTNGMGDSMRYRP